MILVNNDLRIARIRFVAFVSCNGFVGRVPSDAEICNNGDWRDSTRPCLNQISGEPL